MLIAGEMSEHQVLEELEGGLRATFRRLQDPHFLWQVLRCAVLCCDDDCGCDSATVIMLVSSLHLIPSPGVTASWVFISRQFVIRQAGRLAKQASKRGCELTD